MNVLYEGGDTMEAVANPTLLGSDLGFVKNLLQDCLCEHEDFMQILWDHDGPIDGFELRSDINKDLANQRSKLLQFNNQVSITSSVIERTVVELMSSKAVILLTYGDTLIGAIRLQTQSGVGSFNNIDIDQRTSLIIHPDCTKLGMGPELIKAINAQYGEECLMYGIISKPTVIKANIDSGGSVISIGKLEEKCPQFYNYIVKSRGGKDFNNMREGENTNDYLCVFNRLLWDFLHTEGYIKNVEINGKLDPKIIKGLIDQKLITPTSDAQSSL